ncbi:MAG: MmcQ/YjbR family DNA-binding protein [Candidatus Sulfotelmatobacter sp.]
MTTNDFRRLALALPEAIESSHMDHPDFRVSGKIFATLGYPTAGWGMVKLTPEQQHYFSTADPEIFVPVKGAWGRRGATSVNLKVATKETLVKAIRAAWRNTASKRLTEKFLEDVR